MEPTRQVSPRTIKYLCNVISNDNSNTAQLQLAKQAMSEDNKPEVSILNSYLKKRNKP